MSSLTVICTPTGIVFALLWHVQQHRSSKYTKTTISKSYTCLYHSIVCFIAVLIYNCVVTLCYVYCHHILHGQLHCFSMFFNQFRCIWVRILFFNVYFIFLSILPLSLSFFHFHCEVLPSSKGAKKVLPVPFIFYFQNKNHRKYFGLVFRYFSRIYVNHVFKFPLEMS